MSRKALKRIDLLIIVYAVALCTGAWIFYDLRIFLSVLAGTAIAFLNWIMSRRLGVKLIMEEHRNRITVLIAIKMVLIFGVILAVLVFTSIEHIAFMIGLSSLVLGIVSEGVRQIFID